jgi:hypothetical protein
VVPCKLAVSALDIAINDRLSADLLIEPSTDRLHSDDVLVLGGVDKVDGKVVLEDDIWLLLVYVCSCIMR